MRYFSSLTKPSLRTTRSRYLSTERTKRTLKLGTACVQLARHRVSRASSASAPDASTLQGAIDVEDLLATTGAKRTKEIFLKYRNSLKNQSTRRIMPIVQATALAAAFAFSLPTLAHDEPIHVGNVPANVK